MIFKKKEKPKVSSGSQYEKIVISGYECYIVNMQNMFLCGYIKLPMNNPYFGKDYDILNFGKYAINIQTDWTFSGTNIPCCKEAGIGWFLGFDCAHTDDIVIVKGKLMSHRDREYIIKCFSKAIRMLKINSLEVS